MTALPDRLLAIIAPHAAAGHCRDTDCPHCHVGRRRVAQVLAAVQEDRDAQIAALTAERFRTT